MTGVEFGAKIIEVGGKRVKLQIWSLAHSPSLPAHLVSLFFVSRRERIFLELMTPGRKLVVSREDNLRRPERAT